MRTKPRPPALTVVTLCGVLLGSLATVPAGADTGRQAAFEPWAATTAGSAGKAPDRIRVTFYAGLRRDDRGAVDALRTVADPASPRYRVFPSRSRVAAHYGATSQALRTLRRSAATTDLKVRLDQTGVFARVTGRAGDMGRWLGADVTVRRATVEGLRLTEFTSEGKPPAPIRRYVPEFIPLDQRVSTSSPPSVSATRQEKPYSGRNRGTARGCLATDVPELNTYAYSFNQLHTAYGLDALPATTRVGRATRVVVLAQGEGFSEQALAASAACFALPGIRPRRVPVDGLSGALPEGDEGNLDVQVVQSALPRGARVTVIESAPVDPRWFLSWSTAFADSRRPDAVTTSYGVCEQKAKALGPGTRTLLEAVLVRLGLVGTSTFSAAGDRGSSDCINNRTGVGPVELAVDLVGATPWVTSVGGSRLAVDRDNMRVREFVWNSLAGLPPVGPEPVGGGGGRSLLTPRPWWQPAAVTHSPMRTLPDLVANAAPGPGWPLFATTDGAVSAELVGGTSAATPFVAATVGILAARERVNQRPSFGLIQPALYRMSARTPDTFYDIRIGDNDLHDQGCCRARRGYDLASGLGAPSFDQWMRRLPPPGRRGLG